MAWFDIVEDWDLIIVSLAQRNILIDEMSEEEGNDIYIKTFLRLVSGLDSETFLGHIVSIRSEEDYNLRVESSIKKITLPYGLMVSLSYHT